MAQNERRSPVEVGVKLAAERLQGGALQRAQSPWPGCRPRRSSQPLDLEDDAFRCVGVAYVEARGGADVVAESWTSPPNSFRSGSVRPFELAPVPGSTVVHAVRVRWAPGHAGRRARRVASGRTHVPVRLEAPGGCPTEAMSPAHPMIWFRSTQYSGTSSLPSTTSIISSERGISFIASEAIKATDMKGIVQKKSVWKAFTVVVAEGESPSCAVRMAPNRAAPDALEEVESAGGDVEVFVGPAFWPARREICTKKPIPAPEVTSGMIRAREPVGPWPARRGVEAQSAVAAERLLGIAPSRRRPFVPQW